MGGMGLGTGKRRGRHEQGGHQIRRTKKRMLVGDVEEYGGLRGEGSRYILAHKILVTAGMEDWIWH